MIKYFRYELRSHERCRRRVRMAVRRTLRVLRKHVTRSVRQFRKEIKHVNVLRKIPDYRIKPRRKRVLCPLAKLLRPSRRVKVRRARHDVHRIPVQLVVGLEAFFQHLVFARQLALDLEKLVLKLGLVDPGARLRVHDLVEQEPIVHEFAAQLDALVQRLDDFELFFVKTHGTAFRS